MIIRLVKATTRDSNKVKILLSNIKCLVPDEIDKDEVYLKHNGQKIWPKGQAYFRMDVDDTIDIRLEMDVPLGWVEIEVWDFDFTSKNDHLGTFRFMVDNSPGVYSCSMKANIKETTVASYFLNWEILEKRV